jgi:dipeptidyl aminopeptidase/acylaminoacyl peptidase
VRNLVFVTVFCLAGCHYFPNHHLVHPDERPPAIVTWSDDVEIDRLLIHVRAARPPGEGPFPAVIVHPEGGKTADAMQGVIWDLAEHGYVAIAADYERFSDGAYRRSLFAWRSESDATAILQVVRGYQVVDQGRIGLLGFSQGGVFALLIAAHAPQRIRAVVSYYPVTDFPAWLGKERSGFGERLSFRVVRWYFRRESGAASDAEYQRMLVAASPYYVAESIEAPVLLVHGDRDGTAPVDESRRMAERLAALGKPVELLIVPGGVHIFNFRQPEQAASAWQATVRWFDRYLRTASAGHHGDRYVG